MVEEICGAIRAVNEAPVDAKVEGDGFIRVRVTLDISQSLCRGRVISQRMVIGIIGVIQI